MRGRWLRGRLRGLRGRVHGLVPQSYMLIGAVVRLGRWPKRTELFEVHGGRAWGPASGLLRVSQCCGTVGPQKRTQVSTLHKGPSAFFQAPEYAHRPPHCIEAPCSAFFQARKTHTGLQTAPQCVLEGPQECKHPDTAQRPQCVLPGPQNAHRFPHA